MGKSIFSKIFSISDYGETHRILYVLGVKIKFPKSEYIQKQKLSPYESYKKNNVDITQIPPATGQIRDIQLANFELLKELDYVCKKHNLRYWLDYGTLLGAVRHKGFIPWDDDIDTGMMRPDYERLYEVFNSTSRDPDIVLESYTDKKNNTILKICHKKCDYIFADIFAYDYATEFDKNNALKISNKLKNFDRKSLMKTSSFEELENKIKEVTSTYYDTSKNENGVAYGIEFGHNPSLNWFFSQKILFPLKEIEFEGYKFPVFNNYDAFLKQVYGDYMTYPKKFGMGHTMYLNLSDYDKNIIEKLICKKEENERYICQN